MTTTHPEPAELLSRAKAWLLDDPDPATGDELRAVIQAVESDDPEAAVYLADRFSGTLQFGTAGLRGILGAGPNRMNRAVVIRAAAGLTAYLKGRGHAPSVVVGFDARRNSDVFARDTAAVVRAADGWTALGEDVVEAYLEAVTSVVAPDCPRELSVVHTSMHGVGGEIVRRAFARAGFPAPATVAEQAQPDPGFPTVPFPNPEEPGALDLALALARRVGPDVVIASDPDADRCAVAVPDPAAATPVDPAGWRMLRGDEVGVLLAPT